ncbi:MAG: hypothetical protein JW955_22820 [Sedimentisphaerales bacterium]|nr:hypothetical protein [Sedimentisphaerales bacterium]
MATKVAFLLGLAVLSFLWPVSITAQTLPPAAQCLPPDAVICLQVTRPGTVLDLLTGEDMMQAIASLPLYRDLVSRPKFQEFTNAIKFLEAQLQTDWRTGLAKLAGGGITVAVCPQDTVVAIVDAEDETILQQLHEIFLSISRSKAQEQGQPAKVASKKYAGVTAWTFDGKEAHAIIGKRFIFTNRSEALKTVLDLRAQPDGKSLAADPAFQAAMRAAGSSPVAAFVNVKPLLGIPNVAALLETQRKNPLAALTFAAIAESIRNASWLALGLNIDNKTLTVQASTDGKIAGQASPAAFSLPSKAGDGAWPNLVVPRRIAALSVYRDLHGFYAAKDTLFPERTSGLIFFENMMGIFFTGRDLTSEVFAETDPHIRIVVAEQQYDPAIGTPQVKLPAFAVVLRLAHPEQFGRVVEEAWQKAVGLIDFTRGQKAQPGLIIDRVTLGETKYTLAYFSADDVNDRTELPMRYNIRPTLAMPGPYVILSSTDGLARDLIGELSREAGQTVTPEARMHSVLEINGAQTATAFQTNRDTLVRGDMVKKGKSRQEAEAGIDLLITLVRLVDQAKLSIGAREGLTQASFQLRLNLPAKP